jgi:hypothetical protein
LHLLLYFSSRLLPSLHLSPSFNIFSPHISFLHATT